MDSAQQHSAPTPQSSTASTLRIVVAPLSNDPLRDWPLDRYERVARLCLDKLDCKLDFIGTRGQRIAVNLVVRELPSHRCRNLCGHLSWNQTVALIAQADCVVANNSGIAHLAANLGRPTISIFCGSHSPLEWMALGQRATVLTKRTACSPCAIGRIEECPFDRRCFTEIDPLVVFNTIRRRAPAQSFEPKAAPGRSILPPSGMIASAR